MVLDGEEHWLTGNMQPGELTIAQQIERSGAPALLLEHYAGRLEHHEPWHTEREVSHLFRGLVDARGGRRAAGGARPRGAAAGGQRRRSAAAPRRSRTWSRCAATTSCRRAPRRRRRWRSTSSVRGYAREETFAVGDSREDLACAAHVQTFWLVANAVAARPVDRARRSRGSTRTCACARRATARASTRRCVQHAAWAR